MNEEDFIVVKIMIAILLFFIAITFGPLIIDKLIVKTIDMGISIGARL